MSLTVIKNLLTGSGSFGFSLISQMNCSFTSTSPYLYAAKEGTASPGDYAAVFRQGATYNRYSDWGVPSDAKILGIQLLGFSSSLFHDGDGIASGDATFYTNEAALGTFPFGSFSGGSYVDLSGNNLKGSDFVQMEIQFAMHVEPEFIESPSYGSLSGSVNFVQVEVTYEKKKKGGMFFGTI